VTGTVIVKLAGPPAGLGPFSVLAIVCAGASALARAIGIIRWLTATPALAAVYLNPATSEPMRQALEATQLAVNAYGGAIGELLGVALFAALWLWLVSAIILAGRRLPVWLGWSGALVGCAVAAPALSLIGITVPGGVVVGSSLLHLWLLAVAVVLFFRKPSIAAATP